MDLLITPINIDMSWAVFFASNYAKNCRHVVCDNIIGDGKTTTTQKLIAIHDCVPIRDYVYKMLCYNSSVALVISVGVISGRHCRCCHGFSEKAKPEMMITSWPALA